MRSRAIRLELLADGDRPVHPDLDRLVEGTATATGKETTSDR
jgi:hypothetical protein